MRHGERPERDRGLATGPHLNPRVARRARAFVPCPVVSVAAGRVRRETTRTDAGERVLPLLPPVPARPIDPRARPPPGPRTPVFATRDGRPNTPNNVLHHR